MTNEGPDQRLGLDVKDLDNGRGARHDEQWVAGSSVLRPGKAVEALIGLFGLARAVDNSGWTVHPRLVATRLRRCLRNRRKLGDIRWPIDGYYLYQHPVVDLLLAHRPLQTRDQYPAPCKGRI